MPAYQPTDIDKSEEVRNAALFWWDEELSETQRDYCLKAGRELMAIKGMGPTSYIELIFVLCRFIDEAEDGIVENGRTD